MILSIDTETCGAFERDAEGRLLPIQNYFHPRKQEVHDKIRPDQIVQTISITEVEGSVDSLSALAAWKPGPTRVFDAADPNHLRWVEEWLAAADVLAGSNVLYDLMVLRTRSESLARVLNSRHLLVDSVVTAYLYNELLDEKGLKALGILFGTHRYERTLDEGRFKSPLDPAATTYIGADSHNVVLSVGACARRIVSDYRKRLESKSPLESALPSSFSSADPTDKLSPSSLRYFSNLIYTCLEMSEAGAAFRLDRLSRLRKACLSQTQKIAASFVGEGLLLSGKDSQKTQDEYMKRAVEEVNRVNPPKNVLDHPNLKFTDVKQQVSFGEENFRLFQQLLPKDNPLYASLTKVRRFKFQQKLMSTYLWPMLDGARKDPDNVTTRDKVCIPTPTPQIGLAFPSWYYVPSKYAADDDEEGGQKQCRISAKGPPLQTNPPIIKRCACSRWPRGHLITFDLSQIELRGCALLSGDPAFVAEYNKAKPDLHGATALESFAPEIQAWRMKQDDGAYALTDSDVMKILYPGWRTGNMKIDPRQWGKEENFLIIYRGSPERAQEQHLESSGIWRPVSFFAAHIKRLYAKYATVWDWQERLYRLADLRGKLELPITGHSRYFIGGARSHYYNEICNFPIQGVAAVTKLCIQHELRTILNPRMRKDAPIRQVQNTYDAVALDCHPDHRQEALQAYEEAFRRVCTAGYWSQLQDLLGRAVPLAYEYKEAPQWTHRDLQPVFRPPSEPKKPKKSRGGSSPEKPRGKSRKRSASSDSTSTRSPEPTLFPETP